MIAIAPETSFADPNLLASLDSANSVIWIIVGVLGIIALLLYIMKGRA
jgi:hypothetical protein